MSIKILDFQLRVPIALLAVFGILATVRYFTYLVSSSSAIVPVVKYEIRTASGVPLASIFGGVAGPGIPIPLVKVLLSNAKIRPRIPCPKDTKSVLAKLWNAIGPTTVLAQDCVSACDAHWSGSYTVYSQNCPGLTVCGYFPEWDFGCQTYEQQCDTGGSLCGQHVCVPPGDDGL